MKKIAFIFMLASLFACAFITTSGSVFASDESAKSDKTTIRSTEGDVEAFWNSFEKWADLNSAEQAAWQTLGWNEKSWNENVDISASENKKWAELTPEEQTAGTSLGYDEVSWNTPAPAAATEEAPAKEEAKKE
ncbi:MAG: hypothetical protein JRJ44_03310 [Deltaproteobacteria bacterium]|nr:hypothetical protein [Deltaproteobacteria bacterium]